MPDTSRKYSAYTDQELVTLLEADPQFATVAGREVLLRLAHHARHASASSDLGRVTKHPNGHPARYNGGP